MPRVDLLISRRHLELQFSLIIKWCQASVVASLLSEIILRSLLRPSCIFQEWDLLLIMWAKMKPYDLQKMVSARESIVPKSKAKCMVVKMLRWRLSILRILMLKSFVSRLLRNKLRVKSIKLRNLLIKQTYMFCCKKIRLIISSTMRILFWENLVLINLLWLAMCYKTLTDKLFSLGWRRLPENVMLLMVMCHF